MASPPPVSPPADEPFASITASLGAVAGPRTAPTELGNIWPPSDAVQLGPPAGARWATEPLLTPVVPPLWGDLPDPPILNTEGPGGTGVRPATRLRLPLPQRPPHGPPMFAVMPNDRMFTGAPTWNPELPDDAPMPPSPRGPTAATGRHPITGAPVWGSGGGSSVQGAGDVYRP